MHAIYTTPGFIIGSGQYGEAGKLISIFTRDLGLVKVVAQGIRFEKSKLRYHTKDYSFGIFSLVRGKEVWRLTSAQALLASSLSTPISSQNIFVTNNEAFWARIALLLRRFLQGEEANEKLFETISACNIFLVSFGQTGDVDGLSSVPDNDSHMEIVESLLVIRIMHTLGYIGDDKDIHAVIYSNDFTHGIIESASRKKHLINQHINKALMESHL